MARLIHLASTTIAAAALVLFILGVLTLTASPSLADPPVLPPGVICTGCADDSGDPCHGNPPCNQHEGCPQATDCDDDCMCCDKSAHGCRCNTSAKCNE